MKTVAVCGMCAIALGFAGAPVHASVVEFAGSGTSAGYDVSAIADITISNGQLVITLQNTTPLTHDAAQLLTGVKFTLDPSLVTAATLTAATATPRNVADDGTYTDGTPVDISTTWEFGAKKSVYQLDFNPNAEYAVLGPADGETSTVAGAYSSANGSILGNSGHNPYTAKIATFTLSDPDITSITEVTSLTFIYNTGLSQDVPGTPVIVIQPVPEPLSAIFGIALLGVCAATRLRSRMALA
jgi:hypothetical protein